MTATRYTAAERAYLIETYATMTGIEQARALGRSAHSVYQARQRLRRAGAVDKARSCASGWGWTPAEDDQIVTLLQDGYSVMEIAARLRRGRSATMTHINTALGGATRWRQSEIAAVRTTEEVARLFGFPNTATVRYWITRGWLQARQPRGRAGRAWRVRYITDAALQRFLRERAAWPSYRPERIRDPIWREIVMDIRAGAGGEWVRLQDYARQHHYAKSTAYAWVRTGRCQGVRMTRVYRTWYLWSADLDGWQPLDRRLPQRAPTTTMPVSGCIVTEHGQCCGRAIYADDMCTTHYQRWLRHGDPLFVRGRRIAA